MIVAGESKKEKSIQITCECGCNESIRISKYTTGGFPDDYYISILESKFYSQQGGIFASIKHKIKMMWRAALGLEYRLCDICVSEEDIDNLIKVLEDIKKDEV